MRLVEKSNDDDGHPPNEYNVVGIYGWRKRCLYFFILFLVAVIIINLALTIWILVVMDFSVSGMGSLKITQSGIRVEGKAEFLQPLYARDISSAESSPLSIQSQQAVNIVAGANKLSLDQDALSITANTFQVHSQSSASPQSPLLSLSQEQMSVTANQLYATGPLGVALEGSLTTSQIQSPPNEALSLQAPSGKILINGSSSVQIQAGFLGDVNILSYTNITLTASSSIVLDAPAVYVTGLKISQPQGGLGTLWPGTYQVCVCAGSFKLYLAPYNATDCSYYSSNVICP
eukprot:Em0022g173a